MQEEGRRKEKRVEMEDLFVYNPGKIDFRVSDGDGTQVSVVGFGDGVHEAHESMEQIVVALLNWPHFSFRQN